MWCFQNIDERQRCLPVPFNMARLKLQSLSPLGRAAAKASAHLIRFLVGFPLGPTHAQFRSQQRLGQILYQVLLLYMPYILEYLSQLLTSLAAPHSILWILRTKKKIKIKIIAFCLATTGTEKWPRNKK